MDEFWNSGDDSLAERERYHHDLAVEYEMALADEGLPDWEEYANGNV